MERRRITAEDLFRLKIVSDAQVSPDGKTVAFVVTTLHQEENEYRSAIWTVEADGRDEPRRFTGGTKRDGQPRWSPDGARLAFVSDRAGKPQAFVMPLDGGEARKLTDQRNRVDEIAWSPDGRQLAFTSRTGPEDAEEERAEAEGKSEEERKKDRANAVVVVESLKYKADGVPTWLDRRRCHLFAIEVGGDATPPGARPEARQLTDGDWDEGQPAWSPDGREIAFVANREPDRDDNFRSDIWVVPAAGGEARRLTGADGEAGAPAWSPDGATVAYIGHREGDTPGATTRLFTVDRQGGEPRCLTADLDRPLGSYVVGDIGPTSATAQPPRWTAGGAELLVQVTDSGSVGLHRVAAEGGTVTPVVTGARAVGSFSLSADAMTLAFTSGDQTHPAELFALALPGGGIPRQLSRLNGEWLAEVEVVVPERLTWPAPGKGGKGKKKGRDQATIEGWLMKPAGFEEGRTYPLVVQIHGGPHAAYGDTFFHEFQLLAARGYGVLFTNPRGSHGRGDAFVKATHRAWGDKDTADIMAGLDLAIARGWVDETRLGVGGGSYGGFMTNWIIGHSDRFAAAVTMRCVSNLQSFSGTSDCGFDLIPQTFGGPWWENRKRYREYSPLTYLDRATTPTLILHSEQDYRCPIEQAEQVFYILKARGIPTRLVRFPNENHNLSRSGQPQHRVERLGFIVDWFDRFLGMEQAAGDTAEEEEAKAAAK